MSRTTSVNRFVNAAKSRAGVFGSSTAVAIRDRIATSSSRVVPLFAASVTVFGFRCLGAFSPGFTARKFDMLHRLWKNVGAIILDGRSGAGALKKALMRAGVPEHRVTVPNVDKVITAHAEFAQAIIGRTVTHGGDPALDVAVRSAGRRPIGTSGGWGFQSLNGEPVTLLEAVTLAHHGAASPRPEGRSSGRRMVVL